jgi:hypothetical protein
MVCNSFNMLKSRVISFFLQVLNKKASVSIKKKIAKTAFKFFQTKKRDFFHQFVEFFHQFVGFLRKLC